MLYLWSFWDLSYSDTVTVGFDDKRNVMEAIIVVKIVLSCAFFSCNTHDALSAHASCTSLYVCMDVLFSADSWSCAWFKSGRCITLPATMEKKNAFLFSCCCVTSALPNMFGSALKHYLFTFFWNVLKPAIHCVRHFHMIAESPKP